MKFVILILFTFFFLFQFINSTLLFEIQADRERCYVEELYKGSVMMVKWKVRDVNEPDEQKEKQFYRYIQVYILSQDNRILKREFLQSAKGKMSLHSEEEGLYKICVSYHGGWTVLYPALMSLKINSDNMDEPKIESAVKTSDVDVINEKFKELWEHGKIIIDRQTNETVHEDEAARDNISATKSYYYMAVVQVLIIMTVGIYQIFGFRKFLITNNVIY